MITGRVTSKLRRYLQGLIGCGLVLVLLLTLLLAGHFDSIEHRGLDWLQRNFYRQVDLSPDIAMVYIDQKSIDFYLHSMKIGWPWPRDAYALVVRYLDAAGARAVVFDGIFSEPSVFANDYDDDNAFAQAMAASGCVYQTLTFHEKPKGGAPPDEKARALLARQGIEFKRRGGPELVSFQDVTMPIIELAEASRGLGFIDIEPETDGVVRRMRLLAGFKEKVYPTLSLAVLLGINNTKEAVQLKYKLEAGPASIPLDGEGKALINYYGGRNRYPDYTIAALIQSAIDIQAQRKPMVDPALFKEKTVFIGAKAAGLFDLRSAPTAKALPGVDIHATFFNNLLDNDFLERAGRPLRTVLIAVLLLGTVSAAILTRSVISGAVLSLCISAGYLVLVILAFRQNLWLDFITPLGGQAAVFSLAGLINYYGEGRQKSIVRSAFSRYLSPQVVAQVIEHPEFLSLGGSRRNMTCFFSDLAGFTSISEAMSPEELVALLNRYLSLMTKAIMDRGGTVDKFEGDAIMAFWGAPLVQKDHALRACLAALDQQDLMAEFRAAARADGLPELRVRMGLNTGPMIVGNMGSEERFDYTVMGDAVNLASRLEGANKEYQTGIMISEFTYEEVKDAVTVRELDLLRVKGKSEPIRVFELIDRTGRVSKEKEALLAVFARGLNLYRNMEFKSARAAFEEALTIDPQDGPSKTYLERCLAYLDAPPPSDWNRIFTMTSK